MGRGAVTLVMEKSAHVLPEDEAFRKEGVRKIIVGTSEGPQPFVLSADPASPGFLFTSLRTARGLRVQLAPPASASPVVRLSVNLSQETAGATALLRRARDEESDGKLGLAAMAFDRVAKEFHYLPDFRKAGDENALRILAKGRIDLDAGKEAARSGKQFGSAPDLDRALTILEPLAAAFREHPIGEAAGELAKAVQADLVTVREKGVLRQVEAHYVRAMDFEQNKQPALELPLLEEIVRIAPAGNDYRKMAEAKIPEVRGKADEERAALYGIKK
jgi:hypothetical protein